MPQPGDAPGPEPHGVHKDVTAPEAPEGPAGPAEPEATAGPESGRGARRWRRRLGVAAVGVCVVAAGAAPVAWQTLSASGDGPTSRSEALSGPAKTAPAADFDHDGVQDVHVTGRYGGAVSVVYGSRERGADGDAAKDTNKDKGGATVRRQRLNLDSPGVPGREGRGVSFADVTVARDIDGDGYTDLVASVTGRKRGDEPTHPGLIALWGSPEGLSDGTYLKGVPDDYRSADEDDPLVAGDFTGDGHSDLVVRIGGEHGLLKGPFRRDGTSSGSAAVPAPFGDKDGSDNLVTAFAGDLNGDGSDDLVSSHATEDDGLGGGRVETGYTAGGAEGFGRPDTERLPGIETATTGDVDKDGYPDVVLRRFPKGSAPDSAVSGPVEVVHGSADGPDPSRRSAIDQDSPGVPGEKESDSQFGTALEAGDVNGDGHADVAVGTPAPVDAGGRKSTVTVLHGSRGDLTGRGARVVEEPSSAPDPSEEDGAMGNLFGDAVRLGDTDGDGRTDLAVGAPRTRGYEGALWIVPAHGKGWPPDAARSYGPRGFGDPKAEDDEEIGAEVR
ncbi:FG-GAP repeat protein [Streptomyces sp. Amel2xB2]|uniref:FG-GAP and VCBS repeat-containing protein n=1 Tax=Streptomyces sp. Amel2xB2 TaxID=1305829 RepID=UPI000DBFB53E|nr:FG-GAP and VCBS repeat-containing protein [Streptomyces sp. Amel2xB2]RAJ71565.1 FG-GAP repeat protein [Streptomyces sp. Amel2xB2]